MRTARSLAAVVVVVLAILCGHAAPSAALAVYGAASSGSGPSDFYRIFPANYGTYLVGPIGFSRVSSMDIHPVTGVLYACAQRTGDGIPVLIRINRNTGAGTEVGPTGGPGSISDIAFRPSDGALFAHNAEPGGHQLYRIDTATGAATLLGLTGAVGSGNALEFGADGELYLYTSSDVFRLNQANGSATFLGNIAYSPGSGGSDRPAAADQLPDNQLIFVLKSSLGGTVLATSVAGDGNIYTNADFGPFEMDAITYDSHYAAYATLPSGGAASSFYSLDLLTGTTQLIGPIGFDRVGALEQSAVGYGEVIYATGQRPGSGDPVLITIDPVTGDGTEVGPTGISSNISDIALLNNDVLFAYNAQNDPAHTLYTLDRFAGTATMLGDPYGNQGGNGIAVTWGPLGTLYHASDANFSILSQINGAANVLASPPTYVAPLLGNARPPAMDFHWGGTLFALVKDAYLGAGTTRVAHCDYTTQTFRSMADIGNGSFDGLVVRESTSPQAQLLTPNGGEAFVSSTTQEVHWNTFKDHTIENVELALSTGVTLYASGNGNLYRVNPATGGVGLIGPIGFDRVGSIVNHPGKQKLYSSAELSGTPVLIEINPETGHGTPIDVTNTLGSISDLAFRKSDYQLFGYDAFNNPTHSLRTFDINSGRASLVSFLTLAGSGGNGIAFSPGGVLYHANYSSLNTIDPATGGVTGLGAITYPGGLSGPRAAALDFEPGTGVLYALVKASEGAFLCTVDIPTRVVTIIGNTGEPALDGLAFAPGPFLTFAPTEANDGLAYWTVPFVQTDLARIRVRTHDWVGNVADDISNDYFSILGPTDTPAGDVSVSYLAPLSPNPFSAETAIRFRTASTGNVRLSVFDARGRLARTLFQGTKDAGEHVLRWDGRDANGAEMPAGIYIVQLDANGETTTRRGALLR